MYHLIVRRKVRQIFAAISDGDPAPMVKSLSSEFVYRFHGDHALGGTRRTADAMTRWWVRIMRLLPGARFDIEEIIVTGWPWARASRSEHASQGICPIARSMRTRCSSSCRFAGGG